MGVLFPVGLNSLLVNLRATPPPSRASRRSTSRLTPPFRGSCFTDGRRPRQLRPKGASSPEMRDGAFRTSFHLIAHSTSMLPLRTQQEIDAHLRPVPRPERPRGLPFLNNHRAADTDQPIRP